MTNLQREISVAKVEVLCQEFGSLSPEFTDAFASCPKAVRQGKFRDSLADEAYWKYLLGLKGKGAGFIIYSNGQVVGRAAVFVSRKTVDLAYVGCYELALDKAELAPNLLDACVSWAKENAIEKLYGPIDKCTWYGYRFCMEDYSNRFAWEPNHPQQYLQHWKDFGFEHAETYRSVGFHGNKVFSLASTVWVFTLAYRSYVKQGYSIKAFDPVWENNLQTVYDLAINSFEGSFLFEAISYQEFLNIFEPLGKKRDVSPSFFLYDPNGKALGFIISYYDQGYVVLKSLGIHKDCHGMGMGRLLTYSTVRAAAQAGYSKGISACVRQGNRTAKNTSLAKLTRLHKWEHDYQLLKLDLSS